MISELRVSKKVTYYGLAMRASSSGKLKSYLASHQPATVVIGDACEADPEIDDARAGLPCFNSTCIRNTAWSLPSTAIPWRRAKC